MSETIWSIIYVAYFFLYVYVLLLTAALGGNLVVLLAGMSMHIGYFVGSNFDE